MIAFVAIAANARAQMAPPLPPVPPAVDRPRESVPPPPGVAPLETVPLGAITKSPVDAAKLDLVEFRDQPLSEAMRLFAAQTGLNIVASPEARKVTVSLYLHDVTAEAALDALCKSNDLWHKQDPASGVIRISTAKEYQRDLSSFREEQTEVFTLLYPNPIDVANAIRSIYGDRVIVNLQSINDQDVYQDLSQRFNRFDLVDQRTQGFGQSALNNGTGGSGGYGGTGGYGGQGGVGGTGGYGGMNGLNGTNGLGGGLSTLTGQFSRQNQGAAPAKTQEIPLREEFKGLSPEEIEALEATATGEGKMNTAMVDALMARRRATIYVAVIRQHNQLLVRTSDEKTMQQIRDLVHRVDVPTPLVLLEVKVLSVNLGDDFNSVFDYQFSNGSTIAGGFVPSSLIAPPSPAFTTGNILPPVGDSALTRDTPLAPAASPGVAGSPNPPLLFQYVNSNFRLRMQLLENNNRVTTLATPLLLTANNEVSRLFVGQEVPLNLGFTGPTPLVNATGASSTYAPGSTNIQFRPVGTDLLITPNINADRTVTLRILQEVSNIIKGGANVYLPTSTGFSESPIDIVNAQSVSGTVVGMDGLTVAIGGLIQENLTDNRAEVPILGKLPIIGFFFRQQNSVRSRTELVILIRPYVFSTPCESAATSCKLIPQLSIHPTADDPGADLHSFLPHEVLRANPPVTECQKIFRFHSLEPTTY
jgi:general secretion pathway protein D